MSISAQHQEFLERLRASQAAVWAVAKFLSRHNYVVTIPPTSYAPKYEDRHKYKDSGDIWAVQTKHARLPDRMDHYQRIEVKCLSIVFSSYDDFPYTELIVNAVDSHHRSDPIPAMYFMAGADLSHAAVVKVEKTQDQWYVKERNSKNTNTKKDFFHVPLDLATWVQL